MSEFESNAGDVVDSLSTDDVNVEKGEKGDEIDNLDDALSAVLDGDAVENENLADLASEVQQKLFRVIKSLN